MGSGPPHQTKQGEGKAILQVPQSWLLVSGSVGRDSGLQKAKQYVMLTGLCATTWVATEAPSACRWA